MRRSTTLKDYSSGRTPIPDPPAIPKTKAKKDRKRWCRGKIGQEHDLVWKSSWEARGYLNTPQGVAQLAERKIREAEARAEGRRVLGDYKIQVCQRCGKHVNFDWNNNI